MLFPGNKYLTTLPLHTHQLAAALITYSLIFWVISPVASAWLRLTRTTYEGLDRRTKTNWNVRVVSFIQACFICACAVRVILFDGSRNQMDPYSRLMVYSPEAGRVQAFAAGYFLWDLIVSLLYLPVLGIGSLVHAICALGVTGLGFVSFFIIWEEHVSLTSGQHPFANYYGINLVLYEVSTPFLNIHWFMHKVGLTGSTWQLINGLCLLFTFFSFRICWGFYQSYRLYSDIWHVWTADPLTFHCSSSTGLNYDCPNLETSLAGTFLVANTILSGLNVFWFSLMMKTFLGRFQKAKVAKSE